MGNGKKSRFSRAARAETKLRVGKNLINSTIMKKIIKDMTLKDFTDYRKKGNGTVVRGRGRRRFGLGNRDNIRVLPVRWEGARRER